MSQFVHAPTRFFTPSGAISLYSRVVMASDGTISAAGVTDQSIGVAEEAAFTTGLNPLRPIAVRLNTAEGTRKMIAAGSIAKGALVYGAASGKVSTTASGTAEGICMDGASANNDICEVMYLSDDTAAGSPVAGVAAGYKVARGQFTTTAATDTVVTGLATVVSAVANMEDAPAIGVLFVNATIGDQAGAPAAGSIVLKGFKPTASGDATPIAATTFSKKVNWVAVGT